MQDSIYHSCQIDIIAVALKQRMIAMPMKLGHETRMLPNTRNDSLPSRKFLLAKSVNVPLLSRDSSW